MMGQSGGQCTKNRDRKTDRREAKGTMEPGFHKAYSFGSDWLPARRRLDRARWLRACPSRRIPCRKAGLHEAQIELLAGDPPLALIPHSVSQEFPLEVIFRLGSLEARQPAVAESMFPDRVALNRDVHHYRRTTRRSTFCTSPHRCPYTTRLAHHVRPWWWLLRRQPGLSWIVNAKGAGDVKIKECVVVVTGASSGIGAATAKVMTKTGYRRGS
jgi:hypothetical protein